MASCLSSTARHVRTTSNTYKSHLCPMALHCVLASTTSDNWRTLLRLGALRFTRCTRTARSAWLEPSNRRRWAYFTTCVNTAIIEQTCKRQLGCTSTYGTTLYTYYFHYGRTFITIEHLEHFTTLVYTVLCNQ